MVKMMFLGHRRPDITHDQFTQRVLEGHVPLALKHHTTMRRYVLNIAEPSPDGGEAYDNLAALSFESLEDFTQRLYDSPRGEEIIHQDVARFMVGADAYATTERVLKDAAPPAPLGSRSPGVKRMYLVRRRSALSHEEFAGRWVRELEPVARELPGLWRCVLNVVDAHLSETGDEWDGIAELALARAEDLAGADARLRAHLSDLAETVLAYPVAEYVQK